MTENNRSPQRSGEIQVTDLLKMGDTILKDEKLTHALLLRIVREVRVAKEDSNPAIMPLQRELNKEKP